MTPEQQRIAIAEVCPFVEKYGKGELLWRWQGRLIYFDPLNDLNAMHEAEKVVKRVWGKYVKQLNAIADPACATAAQRAEAFLRTLNLWTP
jgi:hypothetical protein